MRSFSLKWLVLFTPVLVILVVLSLSEVGGTGRVSLLPIGDGRLLCVEWSRNYLDPQRLDYVVVSIHNASRVDLQVESKSPLVLNRDVKTFDLDTKVTDSQAFVIPCSRLSVRDLQAIINREIDPTTFNYGRFLRTLILPSRGERGHSNLMVGIA